MCIKFSDRLLKIVSDSISECSFCKKIPGGGACPQTPRRLHTRITHLCLMAMHFRNGQLNLVLIGHSVQAIFFPYIVL